jgi:uncharacterized membrane protein
LGGFADGIVLHQILQWHHMLSETERYPATNLGDLQANVLADGIFHAVAWLFVVGGIAWLWNTARNGGWTWRWRTLLGWMLVGWGVFNMVEGTVNHHLLEIHRVRPEAAVPLVWDIGFLVLGAVLVTVGWMLQPRDPVRDPTRRESVTHPS